VASRTATEICGEYGDLGIGDRFEQLLPNGDGALQVEVEHQGDVVPDELNRVVDDVAREDGVRAVRFEMEDAVAGGVTGGALQSRPGACVVEQVDRSPIGDGKDAFAESGPVRRIFRVRTDEFLVIGPLKQMVGTRGRKLPLLVDGIRIPAGRNACGCTTRW